MSIIPQFPMTAATPNGRELPVLAPGYYLATHPAFRPAVVEFCCDAASGIDPHWRNAQDSRMSIDPRDCGHELTPVTKGRNALPDLSRAAVVSVEVVGKAKDGSVEVERTHPSATILEDTK